MTHRRESRRSWLAGEIALRHLHALRHEHLARYPQLACVAFEHHGITINVYGRDDREQLEYLRRFVADKVVCDVGANIGNHTLAFADVASRVIALEPNPLIYELLKLNCRDRPNITPLRLAASDRAGTARAAAPPTNYGESRITDTPQEGELSLTFDLVRLDDVPELAAERVGLIKIDVEGHEANVLRGAQRLLRRDHPLVVIEQHPDVIANGTSPSLDFLRDAGYSHVYSLERVRPWLIPSWLPTFLRRPLTLLEGLLLGPPRATAVLRTTDRLRKRAYWMLVVAPSPLDA